MFLTQACFGWYGGAGDYEEPAFGEKSYLVAYPNLSLTPGDVITSATREVVCKSGYSKRMRRDLSKNEKAEVYARYGLPYDSKHYQIDHFIPLSLGGSNEPENLWPQPIVNNAGFIEKQQAADYLHTEVCAGRMKIRTAQDKMRADWHAVYRQRKEKRR